MLTRTRASQLSPDKDGALITFDRLGSQYTFLLSINRRK
jgi:hypothetical protein